MSQIRSKIKELEKLQKKVDFLKQVVDFPTKLKAADKDDKEVLPEVQKIVEELINPVIEQLETGTSEAIGTLGNIHEGSPFSEDEVEVLKKLIERATKANASSRLSENDVKVSMPTNKKKGPSDWVMQNQHLGGKKVKTEFLSQEVEGKVISLKEPFVVIELDNGKVHKSTLDKITILEQ